MQVVAAGVPALSPALSQQQKRYLSIHEHMGMALLRDAGVAVPRFKVASSKEEVLQHAKEIGEFE